MIQIDRTLCIRCGKCTRDCSPGVLVMEPEGPVLSNPEYCLGCGHCIAICPKAAVYDDVLDMGESVPVTGACSAAELLLTMRSRRSCRHFKDQSVTPEELAPVLEAARYCPTAKNLQDIRYITVTEAIPDLLDAALHGLGMLGKHQLETASDPNELRRARNFIAWEKARQEDASFDPLFYHAPRLLLFVTDQASARDAAGAAAWAELMAYATGLGCLYSGYFTACAAASPEIQSILQLRPGEQVVRCLVLGHPDIRHLRTVPRKPVRLTEL